MTARLDAVRSGTRATAVSRKPDSVDIDDERGGHHSFDMAVIASHADDALRLLIDAGQDEQEVPGAFGCRGSRGRPVGAVRPAGRHAAGARRHTLRLWRERFVAGRDAVRDLGFDDRFLRMWDFYLAYCEAGFGTGYLDVAQLRLER